MINIFLSFVKNIWIRRNSESIQKYYRSLGVKIGARGCAFHPKSLKIDITRPSLVEIGEHVFMHEGLTILTHDWVSWTFLELYNEFIPSSGRVKIGNNVWFGKDVTVLKGVTIGDNCIIGLGSVVQKDIPANCVAAGIPAKVICSIDEYFEKCKSRSVQNAFEYARSIKERFNREPNEADFFEEFPLFVNGYEIDNYPTIPIRNKLNNALSVWEKNHKAIFSDFNAFMKAAAMEKYEDE